MSVYEKVYLNRPLFSNYLATRLGYHTSQSAITQLFLVIWVVEVLIGYIYWFFLYLLENPVENLSDPCAALQRVLKKWDV